uniref:Uncharacterized protein n=1 Tax=Bursaphelenchus xylophilus TaxID=6326 RepID=A0A1I7SNZ1_BURXY
MRLKNRETYKIKELEQRNGPIQNCHLQGADFSLQPVPKLGKRNEHSNQSITKQIVLGNLGQALTDESKKFFQLESATVV